MTDMTPISSSTIDSIGHDDETHTLRVRFLSGAEWEYEGVPSEVHEELLHSPSPGSLLHSIRQQYTGRRVG